MSYDFRFFQFLVNGTPKFRPSTPPLWPQTTSRDKGRSRPKKKRGPASFVEMCVSGKTLRSFDLTLVFLQLLL